jgi:hypothetical protein
MTSKSPSEKRLEELREQAWKEGVVPGKGVDVAGGPIPRKPGYYGQPVVKPPVWTWEIPLYFFMGGLAGMSAVIASAAIVFHQVDLARTTMGVAAIAGAILSPVLLIMDLGRPRLFLNMLRVFKHRSAMSMGAWILTLFGACAVPGLIALELHAHHSFPAHSISSCAWPPAFSFSLRRSSELCSHPYGRVDWGDRDSCVVFASHAAADSFRDRGTGICRGSAGIVRAPNSRAQLPRVLRGRG